MPIYNIEDSKFKIETISIVQDFTEDLFPSDTILGTPTIDITLLTGFDASPASMLYQGVSIIRGSLVEQRFRQGVPGCIYSIVYTIRTSLGFSYERETFLAVLPLEGNVTPQFTKAFESSCFYPYQLLDTVTGHQVLLSGTLTLSVINYYEALKGYQILLSGILTKVVVNYDIHLDAVTGKQILLGGTFSKGGVPYNRDFDSVKGAQILISGTLAGATLITYSYEVDLLKGYQILTGGTLS